MAYTMQVEGIEELSKKLVELGDKADGVAALSLYEGARVMADAYSAAANGLKAEEFHYAFGGNRRGTSYEEKAAILGRVGIAKFDKNGSEVSTSIGLSGKLGYVQIGNSKIAVRLLINAINKGTEFRTADKAFRSAKNKAQAAASGAIIAKADQLIETMTK